METPEAHLHLQVAHLYQVAHLQVAQVRHQGLELGQANKHVTAHG